MSQRKTIRAGKLEMAVHEAGEGPLVLFLHGFPDTAHTWDHAIERVAAAGFRAVAPFTRGYEPTEIPADGDYSITTLARDALAVIDALGEKQAIVVGHDWGASTAYTVAILAPERVRKLVTVGLPPMRLVDPDLRLLWRAPHFLLFQFGPLSEWYVRRDDFAYLDYLYSYWSPNGRWSKADVEPVKKGFRKPGRLAAALGYYRQIAREALDRQKQELYRSPIKVPTLVFAGDSDILDLSAYDRLDEAIETSHELCVVPRAGHFLHREAPEIFADKLLEFLAG